ncbi:MAG: hypothetical protein K6E51_08495 [Treponema sp.]|nr:hypothetical protein [Treponema sp.]
MKVKILAFLSLVALLLFSCKSTPTAEDVVDETTGVESAVEDESVTEEVDNGKTEAEKNNAKNLALLQQIETARQKAVDAGAQELFADVFTETDALYNAYKGKCEAGSGDDLSSEGKDVLARYQALEKAANAYTTKQKIDELNLSQYDPKNYQKGEQSTKELLELYGNKADINSISAKVDEACDAYAKVFLTGMKKLAAVKRSDAIAAKKRADSVFAGVGEKDAYKAASGKITKADSQLVTNDPEGAYKGYTAAETDFNKLYDSVQKKREAAQKAMEEARAKVEQAAAFASRADKEAPLGDEPVEGIEAEDAVLLEVETYDNPESAVIDVDATADGGAAAAMEAQAVSEGVQ